MFAGWITGSQRTICVFCVGCGLHTNRIKRAEIHATQNKTQNECVYYTYTYSEKVLHQYVVVVSLPVNGTSKFSASKSKCAASEGRFVVVSAAANNRRAIAPLFWPW